MHLLYYPYEMKLLPFTDKKTEALKNLSNK